MTAADALSAVRMAATLPVAWAIADEQRFLAFAWFSAAALTDLVDGWLARHRRRGTLGELLDPLADKVLAGGTALALALARSIPLELAALIVLREGIVAVARVVAYRARRHHGAEPVGKAKTAAQFVTLALLVAAHPEAPAHAPLVAALWAVALFGVVTMPRYRVRG